MSTSTDAVAARPDLVIEGRASHLPISMTFWTVALGAIVIFGAKGLFDPRIVSVTLPFCAALVLGAIVATIGVMTIPRPLVAFGPEGIVVANAFGRRRKLLYADMTWIGRPWRGWIHLGQRGRLFSRFSVPTILMTKSEYQQWSTEIALRAPWLKAKRGKPRSD